MKQTFFHEGDEELLSLVARTREGGAIDLTPCAVVLLFQCGSAGTPESREADITDPDNPGGGLASYRLLEGDLAIPAGSSSCDFWWEWLVVDGNGNVTTLPYTGRYHATVLPRVSEAPVVPAQAGDMMMGLLWD